MLFLCSCFNHLRDLFLWWGIGEPALTPQLLPNECMLLCVRVCVGVFVCVTVLKGWGGGGDCMCPAPPSSQTEG